MWIYQRTLQYPVHIKNPDARAASIIVSQLGGPDGELGASMRYLNQRYSMPFREITGILTYVGTGVSQMAQLPVWSDKQGAYCYLFDRLISVDRIIRYGKRNQYDIQSDPIVKPDRQARMICIYIELK